MRVVPGQFMGPTVVAVFDTIEDTVRVVTPVRPAGDLDAKAAYAAASSPTAIRSEFQESRNKAMALMRAAEEATRLGD